MVCAGSVSRRFLLGVLQLGFLGFMAGNASRENGIKGGRPPGRKNDKTLLLEAEHEAFQQLVLQNLRPIFAAQLSIAKGVSYVYRVRIGSRGGQADPEMVTDPDEILQAIQLIAVGGAEGDVEEENEDGEMITTRYYHITTKAPDGRAGDSLIDRAFGKSVQRIAGGDGGPIQIQGVEISVRRK
jgi:hypothetical protein